MLIVSGVSLDRSRSMQTIAIDGSIIIDERRSSKVPLNIEEIDIYRPLKLISKIDICRWNRLFPTQQFRRFLSISSIAVDAHPLDAHQQKAVPWMCDQFLQWMRGCIFEVNTVERKKSPSLAHARTVAQLVRRTLTHTQCKGSNPASINNDKNRSSIIID